MRRILIGLFSMASCAMVYALPIAADAASVGTAQQAPTEADGAADASNREPPQSGQPCPRWVHDQYVTVAPDGKQYPTWHPPVDPVYGCLFGHEHGADPRSSKASQAMPAFGYVAAQMDMTEPHEGYKVFVLNSGDVADDGRVLQADYRIAFHMGTSGVGRFSQEFHSVIYDYVARDGSGRAAHVQGMADTGPTNLDGATCDLPRRGGKDFSTVGCPDSYEIWGFNFKIMSPNDPFQDAQHVRAYISGSVATFDPILTRDPADNSRIVYTQGYRGDFNSLNKSVDPLSPQAYYQGCQREAYGGPNFWDDDGKASVYYTDAVGRVKQEGDLPDGSPAPVGLLRQEVSPVHATSNEIYKLRHDFCGNGIHAPN